MAPIPAAIHFAFGTTVLNSTLPNATVPAINRICRSMAQRWFSPRVTSPPEPIQEFIRHCCVERSRGDFGVGHLARRFARDLICPVQGVATCVLGGSGRPLGPCAIAQCNSAPSDASTAPGDVAPQALVLGGCPLEIEHVTKRYGENPVVDDSTYSIPPDVGSLSTVVEKSAAVTW